jgi:hypothetical protein
MSGVKEATSIGSGASNPPALQHEASQSHHIGKHFASAHGKSHEGMQVAPSAGPCGLEPMSQADDNSQA